MPQTAPFRWSLVAPLLVLAGLFGMHGLGDHSGAHDPGTTMPDHVSWTTAAATAGLPALTSLPGHDMSGMATGLCVAILLGGLVAWLVRDPERRRTAWSLPRQALATRPVPRSRAPDPPTPAFLSVYRC